MANQSVSAPVPIEGSTDVAARSSPASFGHLRTADASYGGSHGAPYGALDDGDELASNVRAFIGVVMTYRWLILGTMACIVALTAIVTSLQTRRYTATVRLQIEREAGKIVEGTDAAPTEQAGGQEFLRTQLELLKGRQLAERVVTTLQLTNQDGGKRSASFTGAIGNIFGGGNAAGSRDVSDPDAVRRRAARELLDNVQVRPVAGSRLIDVSYEDPSPERAQRVANGYAEVFVSLNLDKRFDANSYAKTFLEDQVRQIRQRTEEAERAVVEYAEREQMLDSGDKQTLTDQNLAIAIAALGAATTERVKAEQLWRQVADATGMNLPQLLSNASIDQLRQRRNALVTEYEEKLETFKPGYPLMVQIKNKMAELDRQLTVEVSAIRDSLKAGFQAATHQEDEMKKRVDELRTQALSLQRRSIHYGTLKREAETNRNLYNNLLQRLKQIDVAAGVGTNNVLVVDRASLPLQPSSPKVLRALMFALIASLVLGVGLAYALELLDDRIKSPADIESVSRLPVLGTIPRAKGNPIAELDDVRSPLAESYRSLATALQFSSKDGLPRSIVLTSGGPAEGKSSTALALARHFAQMGLKVLLIDADLRRPSLHDKLSLDNSVGLSNYLTGAMKPPEVIQTTANPNLAFLSAGPLPPNAADLLSGNRMFSLVTVGQQVFDLIVVDAPPLLGLADAQLLSSATHATIFIAAAGQVRKRFVRTALQRIALTRSNVIGIVLTKFDPKQVGYGYSYSGYSGYGYSGYGEQYAYEPLAQGNRGRLTAPTGAG